MAPSTAVLPPSHRVQTHMASFEAKRCQGADWLGRVVGLNISLPLPLSCCLFHERSAIDWLPLFLAAVGVVWGLAIRRVDMVGYRVTLRRLRAQKGHLNTRGLDDRRTLAPSCHKCCPQPGPSPTRPITNPSFVCSLLWGKPKDPGSGGAAGVARAPRAKNAYLDLDHFAF
ncbi:uncharacterized protein B0H64DRAFT_32774 [Chaetomium fimeti]|uniref:Uncharacterized protein n=1 Tax=Chaetomium fimeti TaxID=1854472 RepID=A0AAE0HR92_9PEZI|nr:hypothetical protein B0H64DRAFT_32774 [Chaetomium fimeti]